MDQLHPIEKSIPIIASGPSLKKSDVKIGHHIKLHSIPFTRIKINIKMIHLTEFDVFFIFLSRTGFFTESHNINNIIQFIGATGLIVKKNLPIGNPIYYKFKNFIINVYLGVWHRERISNKYWTI